MADEQDYGSAAPGEPGEGSCGGCGAQPAGEQCRRHGIMSCQVLRCHVGHIGATNAPQCPRDQHPLSPHAHQGKEPVMMYARDLCIRNFV